MAIFSFLGSLGIWGLFASSIAAAFFVLYRDLHDADAERRDFIEFLRRDEFQYRYRRAMKAILGWVDLKLCAREIHSRKLQSPGLIQMALEGNRRPFSYGLLDFSFFLALFYPIVGLVVQWSLFEGSGKVGNVEILDPTATEIQRVLSVAVLVVLVLCVHALNQPQPKGKISQLLNTAGLSTRQAYRIATTTGFVFAAFVTALMVGPLSDSFPGSSVVVFIGAFAVGMVGAGVYVFAFFIAAIFAIVGDFNAAAAFLIVFALLWFLLSRFLKSRGNHPSLTLLVFVVILLTSFVIAGFFANAGSPYVSGVLLFIGILPLINGIADFASSGATRLFLAKGSNSALWRWAAIDMIVAVSIFLLLGCTIILALWVNALVGAHEIVELGLLFSSASVQGSILNSPNEYAWLLIAMFSTLIPTCLHLAVFLFSFFVTSPAWLRHSIASALEQSVNGRPGTGRVGLLLFAFGVSLSVTGAAFIFCYGIRAIAFLAPDIAFLFLRIFQSWAEFLGVITIG